MIRGICFSTTIFAPKGQPALPLSDCIERAAEAGYKRVELSRKTLGWAACAPHIRRNGLSVWSVHGTLDEAAVSSSSGERQEALAREAGQMEDAAAYAPCVYVVHYLNWGPDEGLELRWQSAIERLLPKAEELDLTLAIETVSYKPNKRARYPTSEEIAAFVRSFESDHLRACIDLNHSNIVESLPHVASNFTDLIANIHVSDNRGLKEEHLPPGEGVIDFETALCALSRAGYAGPLNLEIHLKGQPTRSDLVSLRKWGERMLVSLAECSCALPEVQHSAGRSRAEFPQAGAEEGDGA